MSDFFNELTTASPAAAPEPHVFTVTEITQTVRALLEESLGRLWVEGEVSNYRKQSSGHQYFTLKDGTAQLQCVMFARPGMWKKATLPLSDGMHVRAYGALTVYEARGQYQLNVQMVQAEGAGLLQAKFDALKRKLAAEGLFEAERKRQLPALPTHLALVTSPTGAALRDMLHVLGRRSPWVRLSILPVRVQGDGAAEEIARTLQELYTWMEAGSLTPDAIILARGGGSVEDLWEFNEEELARAIYAAPVPVISAIGHETDFTIADFVADVRAPTPSAAAEIAAPDGPELRRRLADRATRLQRCTLAAVRRAQQHLAGLARTGLFREPRLRLDEATQRLDYTGEAYRRAAREQLGRLQERITAAGNQLRQHRPDRLLAVQREAIKGMQYRLQQALQGSLLRMGRRLSHVENSLRLLSPETVLQRGYAIVLQRESVPVRNAQQVETGEELRVRLSEGELGVVVKEQRERAT